MTVILRITETALSRLMGDILSGEMLETFEKLVSFAYESILYEIIKIRTLICKRKDTDKE